MDYLELFRRYGCRLQTGGSDQFGNIVAGIDLVRRVEGASVHALTTPLMTKADGTKFGKTEGGAVWLDPALTSPYAFYQFWLNSDDRDVPRLPADVLVPEPCRRSRRWTPSWPSGRRRGPASGRWPRSSPRWSTAQRPWRPSRPRRGPCSAPASCTRCPRTRSTAALRETAFGRAGAAGPAPRSSAVDVLVAAGLAASAGRRAAHDRRGRRLGEQRPDRRRRGQLQDGGRCWPAAGSCVRRGRSAVAGVRLGSG